MSRRVAVAWHALFSIAAGVLYFFFVLPRWPELRGDISHTLGTVLRIATGALIGLAGLPVVFTLLRTRRPELGAPQLALGLRTSSIALHVGAGVLIIGTAISEIWLSLDSAGRWLFGIYGAAAAIALLGVFAFYLAFVAELPPPPPKPAKPKAAGKQRRRRKAEEATDEAAEESDDREASAESDHPEQQPAEVTAEEAEETAASDEANEEEEEEEEDEAESDGSDEVNGDESPSGGLRNRRRSGKITLRRRGKSRGGVAVDD